jgi:hypothetical protein
LSTLRSAGSTGVNTFACAASLTTLHAGAALRSAAALRSTAALHSALWALCKREI